MEKWRAVLTFVLWVYFSASAQASCDQRTAKSIADKVTSEIAIMIQFTKAACIPTAEADRCSLLCISDLRIEGTNRNIVLVFITASGGKKMREAGLAKFANIVFADRSLLEKKRALRLSAQRASTLQAGFLTSPEKPEAMAARVGAEYADIDYTK
ncbi:hypothetical protein [Bradyrhizobium sp. USDA 3458]|uniref:hypothetical protein n=1 Tax=Bradyrhizobium sp. USDA 3458 TaxID=2591461 RepID=UPI001142FB96|nr:hypothetical protein [Bradyrhizobium sp. USDA 3458]